MKTLKLASPDLRPPSPKGEGSISIGHLKTEKQKLFDLHQLKLKNNAKTLRTKQTDYEKILWRELRNSRLNGIKFKRQFPIDKYILDFFCYEAMLGIELDGTHHGNKITSKYDKDRTKRLGKYGITILRFENAEVFSQLEKVLSIIKKYLSNPHSPLGEGIKG